MTDENARPPIDQIDEAGQEISRPAAIATVIMARPGDGFRARRIRKFARRHLDELLGSCDPWELAEPIDWHAIGMDLGVPERNRRGRELLHAGWCP